MKVLGMIFFFLCSWPMVTTAQVQIREANVNDEEVFEIRTPSATYIYQKTAGGFSNIYDKNGTDWIQYNENVEEGFPQSAAAHYRGLPNLVYKGIDGGVGHPGFEKVISEQISEHQIRSNSLSGLWQWTWDFYEDHARMTLEKMDSTRAYWFLYEGPSGGKFSPNTHYWGTNVNGPRKDKPDLIQNNEIYEQWQTVYFGDASVNHVFWVHQVERDTLRDLYTYMGNDQKLSNDAKDGMVVFGFGRDLQATPLLRQKHQFLIGFYPMKIVSNKDHQQVLQFINRLKP